MSQISNRFFVTALDDGATLHGNLVADKSLTQAWNGSTGVPDWTVAANQPTITLTLLSGATSVVPTTWNWLYNGVTLTFDANDLSTNVGLVGTFKRGTNGSGMPTLKIVKNLASDANADEDVIALAGSITINNATVDFNTSTIVRIARIEANGFLGVINFKDGIADITEKNQTIIMYSKLYGGAGSEEISYNSGAGYTCKWFVNETEITATTGNTYKGTVTVTEGGTSKTYPALYLNEADVVDYATVRCEFIQDNKSVYKAYVGVDDMQDTEFMYVQTDENGGNAASLRSGESVTFYIWVGTKTDQTVDTTWATFKLKLLNSEGSVITDSSLAVNIPNCDTGSEWRTLPKNGENKAYVQVAYATAKAYGSNLTGIIMAQKS